MASEFSYAGRTRSSDGRRCAASRPTVQAFRTNWRISTPLATGSHGTGIPAAVHDPVSGISPAAPIACQLTELGLTRITARGAGARPCAKVANNPSEPRESPIAATRVGSTSARAASSRSAAANRSSGIWLIPASASGLEIQACARAA